MSATYWHINIGVFCFLSVSLQPHSGGISEVDCKRIKRNAPEVKYFQLNTPIELHCFDEANRPNDDDIIEYIWKIGGYDQHVDDIGSKDYPNYDFLEKKGDISLTVTDDTKEINLLHAAECHAAVKGDPEVHGEIPKTIKKSYKLLEAKKPTVTLAINGQDAAEFHGKERTRSEIRCEAKGGAPPTSITLFLDGKNVASAQEPETARHETEFDSDDNGKSVKCEAISSFELFQPIQKIIKLDIAFSPKCPECKSVEATVGGTVTDSFKFSSNPAPSSYSSGLKNCSDHDNPEDFPNERLKFEKPVKIENSIDEYSSSFTLRDVEESDIGLCIFFIVSNGENVGGPAVLKKKITDTGGLSGGAIAGIVIGVIVLVAVLAAGVWKMYARKKKYSAAPTELRG